MRLDRNGPSGRQKYDQTFIVHMVDGRMLDVTLLDWLELARQEINEITGISSELLDGR